MKIGQKLILGFVGIAMLTAIVGAISVFQNRKTQRIAEKEVYMSISHLDDTWILMEAQEHMEIAVNNYLFLDIGLRERRADYFYEKERLEKTYQRYYKESCVHVKALLEEYHENMEIYSTKIEKTFELYEQGANLEVIKEKVREATKFVELAHEDALEPIIEHVHKEHIEPAKKDIAKGINRTTATTITMSGIAVFLAIGLGFFIARSISNPIQKLHKGTEIIGEGNLDYKVGTDAKDEIGQLSRAFDRMTEDLKKTTTSIDKLNKEITERKKAEGALKEYAAQLKKSNKELDDFTYIASHDLKEPLRSIDAFSKFVIDDYRDKLDEQGKDYLERIRANAGRMGNLIEDLLEISRIERRKNPFEEIEVQELVDEVKLRLEYVIEEKNVQIVTRDKLPRVFCDRVRLTEVFVNLASNAIKFNDKPKPRIEIGSSLKGNYYEFYVKDNGPGIEEQYFDKIFEIFQRLDKREEHEGTGAGLTIAKKIVEMHKGKIWLDSKPGEGTTFYFTIPKKGGG